MSGMERAIAAAMQAMDFKRLQAAAKLRDEPHVIQSFPSDAALTDLLAEAENRYADLRGELERVTAERDEARLVLAAQRRNFLLLSDEMTALRRRLAERDASLVKAMRRCVT